MKEALDALNAREVWDFEVARYEPPALLIHGSNDFTYGHRVEIEFRGVTFCDLPEQFSHAEFLLGSNGTVFVFAEVMTGVSPREFRICAEGVEVRWIPSENVRIARRADDTQ